MYVHVFAHACVGACIVIKVECIQPFFCFFFGSGTEGIRTYAPFCSVVTDTHSNAA